MRKTMTLFQTWSTDAENKRSTFAEKDNLVFHK